MLQCAWELSAPPGNRITLNFTHFDLEGNNQECDYDSVEVYSKLGADELKRHGEYPYILNRTPLLFKNYNTDRVLTSETGTFCGTKPPPMISSEGSSLRIVFTSDNSVQKSGFALVW